MRTIPLSQGKVALVDDEDYERVAKYSWGLMTNKSVQYARCHQRRVNGDDIILLMHRLIMEADDGLEVDHKDHDGLNNQKSNLRVCTRQQNSGNHRLSKNNTTGFKGVGFEARKRTNQWSAYIKVNYWKIHLGFYPTAEEAARAYNRGALKHFGKFALLNSV